jgi:hypothetical protein
MGYRDSSVMGVFLFSYELSKAFLFCAMAISGGAVASGGEEKCWFSNFVWWSERIPADGKYDMNSPQGRSTTNFPQFCIASAIWSVILLEDIASHNSKLPFLNFY